MRDTIRIVQVAVLLALVAGLTPTVCFADAVRFKTPGLVAPDIDLPEHDSLVLVVEGWSASSFETALLRGWKEGDRGDSGGQTFGLDWTGPDERRIVTNAGNAGKSPLRVEVKVSDPAAQDSWDSEKRESAQYGPVVIKGTFYLLTQTVDVRVEVAVRGPDGEAVQSTTASAQASKAGDWEESEENARAHATSVDVIATPLIDQLALELTGFLGRLLVKAKPRSFALEKNKACKKEIAGCVEALTVLKRQDDLVGAYEAMVAIEDGDAWVAYNAAVLAAALHRYDEARGHVARAKELEDHKRFDKLVRYIRDWEAEDQKLTDGGYPLEDPS